MRISDWSSDVCSSDLLSALPTFLHLRSDAGGRSRFDLIIGDPAFRICARLPIREVRDERGAIGPHTSILECEPMKTIDLFYQGEGVAEIEYLEIEPDTTFADLKARLIAKRSEEHTSELQSLMRIS